MHMQACKTRLPMKSGKTNFGYNRKGRKRENQGNVQGSLLSNSSANASYMVCDFEHYCRINLSFFF